MVACGLSVTAQRSAHQRKAGSKRAERSRRRRGDCWGSNVLCIVVSTLWPWLCAWTRLAATTVPPVKWHWTECVRCWVWACPTLCLRLRLPASARVCACTSCTSAYVASPRSRLRASSVVSRTDTRVALSHMPISTRVVGQAEWLCPPEKPPAIKEGYEDAQK
jgi:hypothetical protein